MTHSMRGVTCAYALSLVAGCGSGNASGPCKGIAGRCVAFTAGVSTETEIETAFQTAHDATTLAFGPGTFSFTNSLALQSQNAISVIGAGIDVTVLDFSGQSAGADGLDAKDGDNLTFYDFTVENTAGNGLKVESASNVTFEKVKVDWPAKAGSQNYSKDDGPYGIYPVSVTNLLIENCVVYGGSDSGFYVGQSSNVVVRDNEAAFNVAGIEIENVHVADVYGNDTHDNSAGILAFAQPTLPQEGCHDIHVHDNQMVNNDTPNFAAGGDLVSIVPAGTGFFELAAWNVEVDHNVVTGNATLGLGIATYYDTQMPWSDPDYDPYTWAICYHDNILAGNGENPDTSNPTDYIGQLLGSSLILFTGRHAPDLDFDGVIDPNAVLDAGTASQNPTQVCFRNNATDGGAAATFADLDLCALWYGGPVMCEPDGGALDPEGIYDAGLTNFQDILGTDISPYLCACPAIQGIEAGLSFDAGAL